MVSPVPPTSTSTPPTRRAVRAGAGVLACATAAAGLLLVTPTPATAADGADGAGSGWWYDALVVAEAHQETRGEGASVLLVDGSIDTSVPELKDAGIELTTGCDDRPLESVSVPDAEHATWMAALIKGTGEGAGGPGIAGIAPEADLTYFSLDIDPSVEGVACKSLAIPFLEDLVADIEGGPILSLSVGNLAIGWDDFQDVVEEAGGVAVASAGDYNDSVNKSMMDFPAAHAGWVAVLALDEQAAPWDANPLPYRSLGKYRGYPTISAPGVGVPGFTWKGDRLVSGEPQDGTSPATAIVSGALALVRSKYPEATGNQLIQHLIHFDTDPEKFAYSDELGFGVVSLRNMLANDPTGWPDENPLMMGNPQRVVERFPMSTYDASGDEEADAGARSEDDGQTTAEATSEATGTPDRAPDGGGASALPWLLGGGLAVLLAAGGVVLARRGGGSSSATGATRTNE